MQVRVLAILFSFSTLMVLAGCSGGSGSSSSSGGGGSNQTTPKPPTANAGGPYSGTVGAAINFSGTGSSDPQGQTLTYAWNFGDSATGTGASPSHTYSSVGTYTVSLTVTDTSGLTNSTSLKLTVGLADAALTGTVFTGTQPVNGAHVYLLSANTTGYGGAGIAASSSNVSVSLLNSTLAAASDSVGAYVTTNSSGVFSMSGDYTCTSGQQMYLYATGATGASWMAALGPCPGTSGPAIAAKMNEVSTVAAAFALSGFATDATHVSSSGTTLALAGIANAFANAANLEALSTGVALAALPAGNGTAPQMEIDTLANILASCASGGAQCSTLFANATTDGTTSGTKATETATAAINIAHHPGVNVSALYALASGGTFTPALANAPNDWTVAITVTGLNTPETLAVDGGGNIWVADIGANSVLKLSSKGVVTSTFTGSGLNQPVGVVIDRSGNTWITNYSNGGAGAVVEISSAGTVLSGTSGFTGGGLNGPVFLAVDASGNVWILNNTNVVVELSPAGAVLSGSSGYPTAPLILGTPAAVEQIAIDGSGHAWVSTSANVVELSSAGSILSGTNGYTGGGLSFNTGIAIDNVGNIWVANHAGTDIAKLSNTGSVLSGGSGYTGGGLNLPNAIAIDGAGDAWVANGNNPSITEVLPSGAIASAPNGYGPLQSARDVAVDGSGDVLVTGGAASAGVLTEFIGAAIPVVTPIAAGLPSTATTDGSSKLGTRP